MNRGTKGRTRTSLVVVVPRWLIRRRWSGAGAGGSAGAGEPNNKFIFHSIHDQCANVESALPERWRTAHNKLLAALPGAECCDRHKPD